ncbi:DNA-binding transcriptional activator of the SARP family [Micromonospora citrea]|uniref:DNA-binding transcriptional activator of the SARP family n=1 Tax=Micromonospora citrea TaxID=47855 RepID=A0A1C6TRB4_9ACTN|nr:AfsR/SARP family transcriptional regulator [Micromonospora citrea]SCL44181.1 DNA-binding transcriptional activator of the SARP family [Micromonospora citrea]
MALPEPIRYRILGPVQTKSADGTWQDFRQRKWRTLLAVLLVRSNHVVPCDELVRQLWPEEAPGSQRKLVQQYVHRLRRSLGDPAGEVLRTRPAGYELRVSPGELDADQFDRFCAEGRRALAAAAPAEAMERLGQAMALWRGAAMADVGNAPAIVAERIRMHERRLTATELWLRAGLACGRHDILIPELESLVVAHPLRERLRELLMTALYETGRRADALSVARYLRRLLREELGIDPGAEIQRLERTILLGEDVDLSLLRPLAVPTEF